LINQGDLYVSQYLGDLGDFETQQNYSHTLQHMLEMLQASPQKIIIDQHPAYFGSARGRELGQQWNIPVRAVQHHLAHFSEKTGALFRNHHRHSEESTHNH
jgi:hydrogenase maturation protein HypF